MSRFGRVQAAATLHRLLRRAGVDIVRWPRPHDLAGALATVLEVYRVNCVLDVGANVGQFGRLVRSAGYRGRLVSFEPSPAALPELRRVAARDHDWQVRPVALGSREETLELHRYAGSNLDSLRTALPAGIERFPAMREVGTVAVSVTTLAAERPAAVAGIARPRILVKSDTQGHELEVLAGHPGLPEVVAVLVEISVQAIYVDQPDMLDVLRELKSLGFVPVALEPVTRAGDRLTVIEFDCLAIRPLGAETV